MKSAPTAAQILATAPDDPEQRADARRSLRTVRALLAEVEGVLG